MTEQMSSAKKIEELADAIIRLFTEADMEAFRARSYELAEGYLTSEVEKKWATLIEEMT